MKKKMMITGALLAGTIGAAVCLTGCGTTSINLNDYVKVEYEGTDGSGTATVTLDADALDKDYGSKIDLNNTADFWEYESIGEVITDWADVSLSEEDGLSNGDELTLEWDVLTEYIYEFSDDDFQLSYSKSTYTVEGLE